MIEQLPKTWLINEQFNYDAHETQLGAPAPSRPHSAQRAQPIGSREQLYPDAMQYQQGNGDESKHARPRLDTTDARLPKPEQALTIAEAFFTSEAATILLHGAVRRQLPVRDQVPDA